MKGTISTRLILPTILVLSIAKADFRHVIESQTITNWGTWGELENCPLGTFVTAIQLKVEPKPRWKDDTALNGVRMFCSRLGAAVNVYEERPIAITSSVGPYGEWMNVFRCGDQGMDPKTSAVVGFQLRVEEPQIATNDDTSANNLRIFCQNLSPASGDERDRMKVIEGDGTTWGKWRDIQSCQRGYAVCGIATQVDHGSEAGVNYDDTGLNNVRAECCRIRFHEPDFHELHERLHNNEEIMMSGPLAADAAREFERMYNETRLQHNQPTHSETPEVMHERKSITLPEVLHLEPTTVGPENWDYSGPVQELPSIPPSVHTLPSDKPVEHLPKNPRVELQPEIHANMKVSPKPEDDSQVPSLDHVKPIPPPELIQRVEPSHANAPIARNPISSTSSPIPNKMEGHDDSPAPHRRKSQLLVPSNVDERSHSITQTLFLILIAKLLF